MHDNFSTHFTRCQVLTFYCHLLCFSYKIMGRLMREPVFHIAQIQSIITMKDEFI